MLTFISIVVLLALALIAAVLRKTYNVVPARELKRQAADRNELARALYRAVAYGASLRALLWIVTTLSLSGGLLLLGRNAAWYVSFVGAVLIVWLLFSWLPNTKVISFDIWVTRRLTGSVVWLLSHSDRWLQWLMRLVSRAYKPVHNGLFELNDIMDLLDLQSVQSDSRITREELELMRHVLQFGDRKVRDVLTPRAKVKAIAITDAVGPILLDELHASGQSSFPVKKSGRSKEIIGTLHIGDVGIHSSGTVEKYLTPGVTHIHESDNLSDVLHEFYKTRRQLFVVLDSFEEYVGVLTLESILHELVQPPVADESSEVAEDEPAKDDETVVE